MISSFDYCILGAGLAGVSLSNELLKENASVCLIDPKGIAGGASGTPLGLVNPATGRYASKSWRAEECYTSIRASLGLIQQTTSIPFFKKTGVLRPAMDEKIAERMKSNFKNSDWPKDWISWLDGKELQEFHPDINSKLGGVWLPIALTVDISTYLKLFVEHLAQKGLQNFLGGPYEFSRKNNYWEIKLSSGENVHAQNLVFTSGASVKDESIWSDLPIIPVKGQVAILDMNEPLTFHHAISALGYIASLDQKRVVIGGTYEHKFFHENPDEKGLNYLLNRLKRVLPEFDFNPATISQWSGLRASTPNRMPILGEHSKHEHCFVFTGLSSKGLLYSSYLAKLFADFLLQDAQLPNEVDIKRFV